MCLLYFEVPNTINTNVTDGHSNVGGSLLIT